MNFRLTSFGSSEILLYFLKTYIRSKDQLNKIMAVYGVAQSRTRLKRLSSSKVTGDEIFFF